MTAPSNRRRVFEFVRAHPRVTSADIAAIAGIADAATIAKALAKVGCLRNVGHPRKAVWEVVGGHVGPVDRVTKARQVAEIKPAAPRTDDLPIRVPPCALSEFWPDPVRVPSIRVQSPRW